MQTTLSIPFLLLAIFIFGNSCIRSDCKNSNPVFYKFTPATKEYKNELAKQMLRIGTENLSYRVDKYLKKGDKEFIVIHIQGGELCAKGEIQVYDWGKIGGIRRERNGYRGAELKGLKIEIEQDSTGTNFIYKNIDRIID